MTSKADFPPIIVITGCTASGKSEIAIQLAKKFNGYIVNADSKQVYKEIPIGTSQPTPETITPDKWILDKVDHYLYGYKSIREKYDLFRYQQDVFKLLSERDIKQPAFLVGGSGLYIDSIVQNYQLDKYNSGDSKRAELVQLSVPKLQSLIPKEDLSQLNESDKNNPHRLIRLIERDGKQLDNGDEINHLYLYLQKDQLEIEENIRTRMETMMKKGLVTEAESIKELILAEDPKVQIIGYKEFRDYFRGEIGLEEVEELIILHSRQYAKRQVTWVKRNKQLKAFSNQNEAQVLIEDFLSQ